MLIVVTDILSCPRCGPDFGLVVRADRLENRRVVEGGLGCSNCRDVFPIARGLPDLRYPAGAEPATAEVAVEGEQAEVGLRIAALMGVTGGRGVVLTAGLPATIAGEITALVPEIGVVAVVSGADGGAEFEGVSRVLAGERLPLRSATVRGAALAGAAAAALLDESMRVLVPGARLALQSAPPESADRMRGAGFEILLEQDDIVVALKRVQG